MPADTNGSHLRPITLVLLDSTPRHDAIQLADTLRQLFPAAAREVVQPENAKTTVVNVGGTDIFIQPIEARVPGMVSPGEPRPGTNPDTWAAAVTHRAHIVVTPGGEPDDRLWETRLVTAVTGAIVSQSTNVLAVEWAGETLRGPDIWRNDSTDAFSTDWLPVWLWVDFYPFRAGSGIGIITKGLAPFIGRELELTAHSHPLEWLTDRTTDLASYLVRGCSPGGWSLHDGESFGATDADRIKVTHRLSAHADIPVIAGTFD